MAASTVSVSIPVLAIALVAFAALLVRGWVMHRRVLREMSEQARRDALTKLFNRRAWEEELPRELARARRSRQPLCVALLSLDGFERFAELHGRTAGEAVLVAGARSTQACVREVDTVARIGATELALLLSGCEPDGAGLVLDRTRALFPAAVTFSAGVARWDGEETTDALMLRTQHALAEAQRGGGNRTHSDAATL